MTVVHVDFASGSKLLSDDELQDWLAAAFQKALGECGYHATTSQRVTDLVAGDTVNQIQRFRALLEKAWLPPTLECRSTDPQEILDHAANLWTKAVQARVDEIRMAGTSALIGAVYGTLLSMANMDRLK